MSLRDLPHLNAALNATSALLLLAGYVSIRKRRVGAHRLLMIAAFVVSTVFLASYVTYHARVGSTRFTAVGWVRPVYLTVLLTHVILAALVPPLALVTLWHAARGSFERHRRIARVTWPIWMYVSVTGVVVYVMLYHLYPPA